MKKGSSLDGNDRRYDDRKDGKDKLRRDGKVHTVGNSNWHSHYSVPSWLLFLMCSHWAYLTSALALIMKHNLINIGSETLLLYTRRYALIYSNLGHFQELHLVSIHCKCW